MSDDRPHWWQRTVVKTVRVRESMDDYYRKTHDEWTKVIRGEASEHSPKTNSTLGCGPVGDRFWCAVCHSPWPCRFLRFAADMLGSDVDPHWKDGRVVNVEPVEADRG